MYPQFLNKFKSEITQRTLFLQWLWIQPLHSGIIPVHGSAWMPRRTCVWDSLQIILTKLALESLQGHLGTSSEATLPEQFRRSDSCGKARISSLPSPHPSPGVGGEGVRFWKTGQIDLATKSQPPDCGITSVSSREYVCWRFQLLKPQKIIEIDKNNMKHTILNKHSVKNIKQR